MSHISSLRSQPKEGAEEKGEEVKFGSCLKIVLQDEKFLLTHIECVH